VFNEYTFLSFSFLFHLGLFNLLNQLTEHDSSVWKDLSPLVMECWSRSLLSGGDSVRGFLTKQHAQK
jgi:hypothetical protein